MVSILTNLTGARPELLLCQSRTGHLGWEKGVTPLFPVTEEPLSTFF